MTPGVSPKDLALQQTFSSRDGQVSKVSGCAASHHPGWHSKLSAAKPCHTNSFFRLSITINSVITRDSNQQSIQYTQQWRSPQIAAAIRLISRSEDKPTFEIPKVTKKKISKWLQIRAESNIKSSRGSGSATSPLLQSYSALGSLDTAFPSHCAWPWHCQSQMPRLGNYLLLTAKKMPKRDKSYKVINKSSSWRKCVTLYGMAYLWQPCVPW